MTQPPPSTELGETTTQPTWSPDGTKLAFANRRQIYTVNPDGTDRRYIWSEENPVTPTWTGTQTGRRS